MVQVVLSGAVPLRLDEIAETVGLIDPSYWAMNMMAGIVNLNSLVGHTGEVAVNSWEQSQASWRESFYALSGYTVPFASALMGASRALSKSR